jgi:hypothetical protein
MRRSTRLVFIGLLTAVLAHTAAWAVDAKALGTTEALLKYCAKADSGAAEGYRKQVTRITQGASSDTLAAVRGSADYLKAKTAVEEFVKKVDPHNARKMCSESVAAAR